MKNCHRASTFVGTFRTLFIILMWFIVISAPLERCAAQGGPGNNPDLLTLILSAGTLNPSFSSATTNYSASVVSSITSITVTPTTASGSATIQVRVNGGTYVSTSSGLPSPGLALNVGTNPVEIKVTSGNLTNIKIYTVAVARAAPPLPDVQTVAAAASVNSATLSGTVNPLGNDATAWFEWGVTTNYGIVTSPQTVGNGANSTNYSTAITGLTPTVTYNFRAAASNVSGVVYGTNQSFSATVFANTGISFNGANWGCGDVNGDGLFDVVSYSAPSIQIGINTGTGFTNLNTQLPPGRIALADFDNDDKLDISVLESTYSPTNNQVWKNTGTGFSKFFDGLTPISSGMVSWGDTDNDGKLDLFLTDNGVTELWRNTGSGFTNVSQNYALPTPLTGFSISAFGDYNSDGKSDLIIVGASSKVWRNTETAFIAENVNLTLVNLGAAAWGDYDNDGRLDFIVAGVNNTGSLVTQLWHNSGTNFVRVPLAISGLSSAYLQWGDYDNDGKPDILVAGSDFNNPITEIWRNTGSGFTKINAGMSPSMSAYWMDFDNDGRLDVLTSDKLWKNYTAVSNTPPTAPTGLSISVTGTVATLSWNAGSDAQTPASGLSYNLRIGTTPGGSEVTSVMAGTNGYRRICALGNAQERLFYKFNYKPGISYYWSVQAIDTAYTGSPFSAEANFKIFSPSPVIAQAQATSQPIGDLNGDGIVDQSELNQVYASFVTNSPFLLMTNVAGLGGTNVTFALSNDVAGGYTVQYSTDLVNWTNLGTANPRYLFIDTNAPAGPQRYYRLRYP